MPRETFYEPTTGGYERAITERLRHWAHLRATGANAPADDESAAPDTD